MNSIFKKINTKLTLTYSIALFGSNFYYKAKLFFYVLFSTITKLLPFTSRFKINFNKKDFYIHMSGHSDIAIFHEIFIKEGYSADINDVSKVIFDLGSNVGFSVLYLKSLFPNATLYAFEPNPIVFEKLALNCKHLPDTHCFNVAIASEDGEQKFFVSTKLSLSSSFTKRDNTDLAIVVKTRSLDSIMTENSLNEIDLLKFDIEGGEYDAFKSFANLKKVKKIIGELHLDLIPVSHDTFTKLFNDFSVRETPRRNIAHPKRFIFEAQLKSSNGSQKA